MKVWAERRHWRATLRWQTEALHMMSSERFDRAADFIDQALAVEGAASQNRVARRFTDTPW